MNQNIEIDHPHDPVPFLDSHPRINIEIDTIFCDPTYDQTFKLIFEDTTILSHFINSVIHQTHQAHQTQRKVEVRLGNTVFEGSFQSNEKGVRFDVLATDQDDNIWIVEMQRNAKPDFLKRLIYYGCRKYGHQLSAGDEYSKLKKVHVIAVLRFNALKLEGYLHEIKPYLKPEGVEFDQLAFYIIELPKYKSWKDNLQNTKRDNLTRWLDLFSFATKYEAMPKHLPPEIRSAYEKLRSKNFNEEERYEYNMRVVYFREVDMLEKAGHTIKNTLALLDVRAVISAEIERRFEEQKKDLEWYQTAFTLLDDKEREKVQSLMEKRANEMELENQPEKGPNVEQTFFGNEKDEFDKIKKIFYEDEEI